MINYLIHIFIFSDGTLHSHDKLARSQSVSRTSSAGDSPFYEDYAEIVDEEADYSSPSRDFELGKKPNNFGMILQ